MEYPSKRIGSINQGVLAGCNSNNDNEVIITTKDIYKNGSRPPSEEDELEVLNDTTLNGEVVIFHG